MADDQARSAPPEEQPIAVSDEQEVAHWSRVLGVTPDQLREAVRQVGPKVADVKKRLGEIQVRHS